MALMDLTGDGCRLSVCKQTASVMVVWVMGYDNHLFGLFPGLNTFFIEWSVRMSCLLFTIITELNLYGNCWGLSLSRVGLR